MFHRKQNLRTLRKTLSIDTQSTDKNYQQLTLNLGNKTSRYLYDPDQELSLLNIASTERKLQRNTSSKGLNTSICHLQQAKTLVKRFERAQPNPFLKRKLNHIMKKEVSYKRQIKSTHFESQDQLFKNSKFLTLKSRNVQNLMKKQEVQNLYNSSISIY